MAKTATDAGVELRYRTGPAVLSELTELAELETACCGFAEWKVTEARDAIWLAVETERANAPAVWAMFDERPPASMAADLTASQGGGAATSIGRCE